jgi:hypothetical protein
MSKEERYEVLASLPFMEGFCVGAYRIIGTPYVYYISDGAWALWSFSEFRIISFEEVWDGVDDVIRGEMVFHLDLFR